MIVMFPFGVGASENKKLRLLFNDLGRENVMVANTKS